MDIHSYDKYLVMSKEREEALWKDCVFVFDSSALLGFYAIPEVSRTKTFNYLFPKIQERLWIPSHVQFEYLKNREKVILEPIEKHYVRVKVQFHEIKNKVNQIDKLFKEQLIDKTKKEDKHPHLNQAILKEYSDKITAFKNFAVDFQKKLNQEVDATIERINDVRAKDDVLDKINTYFKVGKEYIFNQILEITREGKHRYKYSIPPGYMDLTEKEGTQKFGDLIIWKQILEYATDEKRSIVLVCNDMKEDWWRTDESKKDMELPRTELIKEFRDSSGKDFWMYNLAQFLHTANSQLKTNYETQEIDSIAQIIKESQLISDDLIVKCDKCQTINSYKCEDLKTEVVSKFLSEYSATYKQMVVSGVEPPDSFKIYRHRNCNCGAGISILCNTLGFLNGSLSCNVGADLDNATLIQGCQFTFKVDLNKINLSEE